MLSWFICMIIFSFIIFIRIITTTNQKTPKLRKNWAHQILMGMMAVVLFMNFQCHINRTWMKLMVAVKCCGRNKGQEKTKDARWRSLKVNKNCFFFLNLNQFSQFNCKIRLEQVENVEITIIRKRTQAHTYTHIYAHNVCAHVTIVGDGFVEWKALKIYGINHANKLNICATDKANVFWSSVTGGGGDGGGAQILKVYACELCVCVREKART